jgi:hypothetical protein
MRKFVLRRVKHELCERKVDVIKNAVMEKNEGHSLREGGRELREKNTTGQIENGGLPPLV